MSSVIIIGGGAAGMMAAIVCARNNNEVLLLEKNEKLGKKLFITGKGRCNFTNASDMEEIQNSVVTNKKFLYSAFNGFSNYDAMGFFDELGLKFKIERGNRVFPESDHSYDVINALEREMKRLKVKIMLNTKVLKVFTKDGMFDKVRTDKGDFEAENLIIATGGCSYPSTGSTGDGYEFAKTLGHNVTKLSPALVPFTTDTEWVKQLQGLSLKNVSIEIFDNNKMLYSDFGEMLFTHFGVSGPTLLSASSFVAQVIKKHPLKLVIDLKPALDFEKLDERILRDFDAEKNKSFKNALGKLLPQKLIPVVVELSRINPNKQVNSVTKEERHSLVRLIKNLTLNLTGLRGFNEAIITQGGVDVKQINPKTMESKLVKNVYFAGEIMDVDAVTGGFNLQIAWSSAYAAAMNIN